MKKKKRSFGKILLYILLVIFVVMLVVLPFVFEAASNAISDTSSILSTRAEIKTISKSIFGTGTLTDEDEVAVELPYGVEVTKYLVSNNDFVTAGTPLAEVDRIEVMNAIYEYQDDMAYVEEQMKLYTDTGASSFLTTSSKGRVMELYGKVGDEISDVMLEHGALAVISLDGLLAVDVTGIDSYAVGSTLLVAASNGSIVPGRIESRKEGVSVITLNQEGEVSGDKVDILDNEFNVIASGELYVHSPLRISGYSGVIEAVHVVIDQDLVAGATLFTYSGNPDTAEYGVYAARHRELEDLTETLFKMYTDGTVNAPCSGVVTGIDDDTIETLSTDGETAKLVFLKNTPSKPDLMLLGDETEILNGFGYSKAVITGIAIGSDRDNSYISFSLDNGCYSTPERAKELFGTDNYTITESFSYFAPWLPVNKLSESSIGLELIFTFSVVNGVRQNGAIAITSELSGSSDPVINDPIGNLTSSAGMTNPAVTTKKEHEYYSTKTSKPMSVVPQDIMTVDITVDELDILLIEKGQYALITLDALPGQSFDGTITDIGVSGSNSGGNSKYIAEVTVKRVPNMIGGMNATANIIVSSKENILTLPAEAIVEENNRCFVYTGYDEQKEELVLPVDITTGDSDGISVEILSGLSEGQTVWYKYLDQPSISLDFIVPPNRD